MLRHDIYARTLRDHWKGVLGWGLGLAAIAALEIVVYPSIRKRAEEIHRLVASYPEAFKAMFGLEDFTSGAGFIQAELSSLVVPLVLIALAISFGAGATAGEEEHKTVDLLLATPVTRGRVVIHKLLARRARYWWACPSRRHSGPGQWSRTWASAWIGCWRPPPAPSCSACALAGGARGGLRDRPTGPGRRGRGRAGHRRLPGQLAVVAGRGLAAVAPADAVLPVRRQRSTPEGLDLGDAAVLLGFAAAMALAALVAFQRRDLAV